MTGQLVLQLASATGAVNVSPTWNNGAVSFVGIYGRVTNTASGASSKLIDLGTVASGSIFSVAPDSSAAIGSHTTLTNYGLLTTTYIVGVGYIAGTYAVVKGGGNWVFLFAPSPSVLELNGIDNTSPLEKLVLGSTQATTGTTVTLKAGDVTTGNGSDLSIEAGVGSVSDGVVNIGRTTSSRVGFFYANSHAQINTSGGSASHITGTGSPVYDDDTFDNYTIAQVVAALRSYGLLA